ncbi:MAG: hypothetical protein COA33_012855 [Fluviicola sp.]|nr:hypothetical protein [Fluviicola sp.]
MDCIYSINGTISTSRVFDRAFSNGIPVVMNWVGTDVIKAQEAFKLGVFREEYLKNAIHFCEVEWIKEELKEIGIEAKIVSFVAFDKSLDSKQAPSDKLNVLSYIPSNRAGFYGMTAFLNLAKSFPQVNFIIAGSEGKNYEPLPINVKALGWVENMDEVFNYSQVCLRFPEHDGLSIFILESLARGKNVLYKYPFNFCNHCPDEKTLKKQLALIEKDFRDGVSIDNPGGADFIKNNYSFNSVYGTIVKELKKVTHAN